MCQPTFANGLNCSRAAGWKYVENFTCGTNISNEMLKKLRLSFPSSHASFSAYTMAYSVVSIFPNRLIKIQLFCKLNIAIILDLSADTYDMEWIETIQTFFAICATDGGGVHQFDSNFRQQASLVRCIRRHLLRSDGCITSGEFHCWIGSTKIKKYLLESGHQSRPPTECWCCSR